MLDVLYAKRVLWWPLCILYMARRRIEAREASFTILYLGMLFNVLLSTLAGK